MGSGKSSVGRILADLLRCSFIDLDRYIEDKSGKSVREIFETNGEECFRRLESQCLHELLTPPGRLVLSLGGGTLIQDCNSSIIAQKTVCIYLKTNLDTLKKRLAKEKNKRPLLLSGSIEELLDSRIGKYEERCDQSIDTDNRSPEELARSIADLLAEFQ